ncbi:hypothetical protein HF209_30650 [Pseudomonas sp. WS 5096]|uniref:Entry exclusion lipoprotein TrbK n=1 Tax=Pseudomonas cremoris TaxID=2724178 RepID=A0ABR6TIE4_9PSED|nr:hypothetical protein [Pseudomonas cremoris]MBC2385318.1 hypothetical protein [Pseudomonas cremoris]
MNYFARNAGTVVVLVIIAGLLVLIQAPATAPKETRQQYFERCIKPQEQPFKRDLGCIQDSQKFRPYLTTPEG